MDEQDSHSHHKEGNTESHDQKRDVHHIKKKPGMGENEEPTPEDVEKAEKGEELIKKN